MFDLDTWQEIILTITRNKMRSFMTAFGVFWGIFMLVVMTGAGTGLSNGMYQGIQEFASNSMFMFPGRTSMPFQGLRKGRAWQMKTDDIGILKHQFPEIKYISGIVFGGSSENNINRGDKYGTFNIQGYHPEYMKINPQRLLYGRHINEIDIQEKRKVCVIGKKVYNDLFHPEENPIGVAIKIRGIYYTIVGATEAASRNINIGGDAEEMVSVPITTLQQSMNLGNKLHSISITAEDTTPISTLEEEILRAVKSRHQVAPDDPSALNCFNVFKIFSTFQALFTGISILIWIVGTGTLLAGAVGVSNIMLITVNERTQEIGIRRALGAKPKQIIMQIICESIILTAIAGFMGIMTGVGVLAMVDKALSANPSQTTFFANPQISFNVAISATLILIICGIFAGMLPSYRALKIKAIEALRTE